MASYYVMNKDKSVIPAIGVMSWSMNMEKLRESGDLQVGRNIVNGYLISTVFLGLNHRWGKGDPQIFETMIFNEENGRMDCYCERYSTYQEALSGHNSIVDQVTRGVNMDDLDSTKPLQMPCIETSN